MAFATERLFVDLDSPEKSRAIHKKIKELGFWLEGNNQQQEEVSLWKSHSTFVLMALLTALATLITLMNSELGRLAFYGATGTGLIPFARKALSQVKSGTWFGIGSLDIKR